MEYIPGTLIVKYKEIGGTASSEQASLSLDHLRAQWGVTAQKALVQGFVPGWEAARKMDVEGGLTTKERTGWYWYTEEKEWMPEGEGGEEGERLAAVSALEQFRLQDIQKLTLSETADVLAAAKAFSAHPAVEYAHPDYVMKANWTPNDRYYPSSGNIKSGLKDQWPLYTISASQAWDSSRGNGIIVAVVDTGVDYNHPDLAANVWINRGEDGFDSLGRSKRTNGVDDDRNGLVDDWRGYDFTSTDGTPPDNDPMDDYGHGTHVAGIIGALTHNSRGIAAVAPGAKIMAVKGLGSNGQGALSDLIAGIVYAANSGAKVINASWGGGGGANPGPTPQALIDAVGYVHDARNVVFVAPAGNGRGDVGTQAAGFYPACIRDVICVSGVDHYDNPSAFSNRGTAVDLAAPGGGEGPNSGTNYSYSILSLLSSQASPRFSTAGSFPLVIGGQYLRQYGTSMSAAYVSGAAALIRSRNANLSAEQVRQALRKGADDRGISGFDHRYGYGRLNAASSLGWWSPLEVRIGGLSGTLGDTTRVTVTGTVAGPNLTRWLLEWGQGSNPSAWTRVMEGTSPVRDGTLCVWDMSSMDGGDAVFRLTAWNRGNAVFEDRMPVKIEQVKITDPPPEKMRVVKGGGNVSISGTVSPGDFRNYRITIYKGNGTPLPDASITLANGGNQKVSNGLLATWNTAGVPADAYRIELRVKRSQHPDSVLSTFLGVDPALHTGWPANLKTLFGLPPHGTQAGLNVADLDGDGRKEMILTVGDRIGVLDDRGRMLSGWPRRVSGATLLEPVVGDLDGDGRVEIVVPSRTTLTGTLTDTVYAWKGDGSTPSGWPRTIARGTAAYAALADLDGDGYLEVILTGGNKVTVMDRHGYRPGWPVTVNPSARPSTSPILSAPAIGSFGGATPLGIVVVDRRGPAVARVYDGNGGLRYSMGVPGNLNRGGAAVSHPAAADLDGQPGDEIVLTLNSQVCVFKNGSLMSGWPSASLGGYSGSPSLGPLPGANGVTRPLVFVGTRLSNTSVYPHRLNALDLTGRSLSGWPVSLSQRNTSTGSGFHPLALADVNGDGSMDIISASAFDPAAPLGLHAYDTAGRPLPGFPKPTTALGLTDQSAMVDDLDGDGFDEMAWVDSDLNLYLWDLPTRSSVWRPWPMTRRDPERTGRYRVPNRAPTLDPLQDRTINAGNTLQFNIQANDPDPGDTLNLSMSGMPSGATLTRLSGSQWRFDWGTNSNTSGVFNATFTVSDGQQSASRTVKITVNSVNRPPQFQTIGNKTVQAGALLTFTVRATDPEGAPVTYGSSNLPAWATLSPTLGTFRWTPAAAQAGVHPVTFTARDPGGAQSSAGITITVTVPNRPPVLSPIGNKTATVGSLLQFTISATDPDGNTLTFSAGSPPQGATLTGSGLTRTFSWTPTAAQAGNHNVTFRVTDPGGLYAERVITVAVSVVNRAPVMNPIGNKTVILGNTLQFTVSATDPDGNPLTYSASNLPYGCPSSAFNPATRTFTWTPDPNFYTPNNPNVRFTVTDSGGLTDYEEILIQVLLPNRPPVLSPVGNKSVNAGSRLFFQAISNDPDGGDAPTFSADNLPPGATFRQVVPGAMGAFFEWTPTLAQAGVHNVTLRVTDSGGLSDEEAITLTVGDLQLAPVGNKTVNEGSPLSFTLSATGAGNSAKTYSASNLPAGAALTPAGVFSWTPGYTQAGTYSNVRFMVAAGDFTDLEPITITVNNTLVPPELAAIGDKSVDEGVALFFTLSATHPDGLAITYRIQDGYRVGMFLNSNTGGFGWGPTFSDAGVYPVTFRATAGSLYDEETITLTVRNVNRPPVLTSIGNRAVDEMSWLNISLNSTTDPDGDTLTFSGVGMPSGAIIDTSAGKWFKWQPTYAQAGTYTVTLRVSDGDPVDPLTDEETFTITVNDVNGWPALSAIGSKTVTEGQTLTFTADASDPDGDPVTFSTWTSAPGVPAPPAGAELTPAGLFTWTPTFTQAGAHAIGIKANDAGHPGFSPASLPRNWEAITVTVVDAGSPPVLSVGPLSRSVNEGAELAFAVSATDPDSGPQPLSYSASGLPSGATFDASALRFSWTPGYSQHGQYPVLFSVTDGQFTESKTVTITVVDRNGPPTLDPIGDKTVSEDHPLEFTVTGNDPDGDNLTFYLRDFYQSALPQGVSFNGQTGLFRWTPNYNQGRASAYRLQFGVSDGSTAPYAIQRVIDITVNNTNRAPVLDPVGDKSVIAGNMLSFSVRAVDPDQQSVTYSSDSPLPSGATLNFSTGRFDWRPANAQVGDHTVTLRASDGELEDSETVTLTVTLANRPPVLDPIGNKTGSENSELTFTLMATDPDGDTLSYSSTTPLPFGVSLHPTSGVFRWTPDYTQGGTYTRTLRVSDGQYYDNETITITISNTNRPPVMAPIEPNPKRIDEGELLTFAVTATDPDGNPLGYSASDLPQGAVFNAGARTFSWTPGVAQAGNYSVVFTVIDGQGGSDSKTAAIIVGNVNAPPALDPIGNKTVAEGALLTFTVSATDPDGDTLTYSAHAASGLPEGAVFDAATRTFSWTPGYDKAGDHNVGFNVTDGALSDYEAIVITVTQTNRPPVLDPIGDKAVDEGETLEFTLTATDPDGDDLTYFSDALLGAAEGATLDGETGVFRWTPRFDQAGVYELRFYVRDHAQAPEVDFEIIHITVDNVNAPPVLDPIGNKTVAEGAELSFTLSATDPEGGALTYSADDLPQGASFNAATKTFSWTPGYDKAGSYPGVKFTVSDGTLTDEETIIITVTNVNRPPELAAIGNKNVNEGAALSFTVSATDPDGQAATLSATGLPSGASFVPGTGLFSWTPGYDKAGDHNVTFTAGDGALSDSETVTITVANVPQAPVLAAIGNKTVHAGSILQFGVTATDADGGTLTYTASGLPSGAIFNVPPSYTQTFRWMPTLAQVGNYSVTFTVSDGTLTDSETITVGVDNPNQAPQFNPPIGNQSVNEGQRLVFIAHAFDPNPGDTLTFQGFSLPPGAQFVGNPSGDGTAVFDWTPGYTQAGTYNNVRLTVRDPQNLFDADEITITVVNVNAPPVLAPIGNKSVNAGGLLSFSVSATDIDNDPLMYSIVGALPAGASWHPPTRTFSWTPAPAQVGAHSVVFRVSDGHVNVQETVVITVNPAPRPPALASIGNKTAAEGAALSFTVSATDPDGGALTYAASGVPAWAAFDASTRTFSGTPNYTQAGSYNVTFTVTDLTDLSDTETITIAVSNTNRPPVLAAIGSKTVAEGVQLTFAISATDPDGQSLTYSTSALPFGATFTASTRTFRWTPTPLQQGVYEVTFSASDGSLFGSEVVEITVTNVNRPPVLAPIGNKTAAEGTALSFTLSATDPDGDNLVYSATGLPAGAALNANTGAFRWTPDYTQSGNHNVTFRVSDGTVTDDEAIIISVSNTNRAPVLDAIGNKTAAEGALLTFTVSATDPDGQSVFYSASNRPSGAAFDAATRTFSWTPTHAQAGTYTNLRFTASDGTLTDFEEISVTVTNVNQPPVLAAIGNKNVNEGALLTFTLSATDPDGSALTYSADGLPAGASFNAATRVFSWTPGYDKAGSYPNVRFTVSDGTLTDDETITVTVADVNQPPVLAAIGNKTVNEEALLTFTLSAADPDGDALTYSASSLPTGAVFDAQTRIFSWTPTYEQAGMYNNVTFTVSDGTLTDGEAILITVANVNRPPVLAAVGNKTVAEGALLTFTLSATDPDGGNLSYTASGLPTGANFGGSTFVWTPTHAQAGSYDVTFNVSDGSLSDSETITVTVSNVNRPPVLSAIGNKTTNRGDLLTFTVSAADPDGDVVTYAASNLPSGASLTLHPTNASARTFSWRPGPQQAGSYPGVQFTATDGGSLSDSEVITITVVNSNREPDVVISNWNWSVREGEFVGFHVTGTDPDGDPVTLSNTVWWINDVPWGGAQEAAFNPQTGAFSWTPSWIRGNGDPTSYRVGFYVNDGRPTNIVAQSRAQVLVFNNPFLDPLPDLPFSVNEGQPLSFRMFTGFSPGTTVTATALPPGATFNTATRTFNWTPGFQQAGVYRPLFTASGGGASISQYAVITVVNVNTAPVMGPIGNKTVGEGTVLEIRPSATDAQPGDTLTWSASYMLGGVPQTADVPPGASFFSDDGYFRWEPTFLQAAPGGTYQVTFYVSDGEAGDSEQIHIMVTNTNRLPDMPPIFGKTVAEAQNLSFTLPAATDFDTDDTLTYSAGNLPTGASFNTSTRAFSWTPTYAQSGSYSVTFTVNDGKGGTDSEAAAITVTDVNRPPALNAIGNKTVDELQNLSFTISGSDPDGDPLTYSWAPLSNMTGASFNATTRTFSWTPAQHQQGTHQAVFTAWDGKGGEGSETITITVNNVNRPPYVIGSPIGNKNASEGFALSFSVQGILSSNVTGFVDPDGDPLAYSLSNAPTGAAINASTGVFSWTPGLQQAGSYTVGIRATDGSLSCSENITIAVADTTAPQVAAIPNHGVDEGATLTFTVSATDSDNDPLTFSVICRVAGVTQPTLPAGAVFDAVAKRFTWTPDFDQAGSYDLWFSATDGSLTGSRQTAIIVRNVNRHPVLDPVTMPNGQPPYTWEGQTLTLTVSATDPDGDAMTFGVGNRPPGSTFNASTRTFTWTPTLTQSGIYRDVLFTVGDTLGGGDTENVSIIVYNTNQRPELLGVGDRTVNEGATLTFTLSALDPDVTNPDVAETLTFSAANLPLGATFNPATKIFTWTPNYAWANNQNTTATVSGLRFTVTDAGNLQDSKTMSVAIHQVNQAPDLNAIADQIIAEGTTRTLTVSATDGDLDTLIYSMPNLDAVFGSGYATFNPATRTVTLSPGYDHAGFNGGVYPGIQVYVWDGHGGDDTETFTVTVPNTNRAPVMAPISDQIVQVGAAMSFTVSATDPDGDALTYSAPNLTSILPAVSGAAFNAATRTFIWTPTSTYLGEHTGIKFRATDRLGQGDSRYDEKTIKITVIPAPNTPPVLNLIGNKSVNEGGNLNFTLSATDPQGDPLTYAATSLPPGATFSPATRVFDWSPGYGMAGPYANVRFMVTDSGGLYDFEMITVTCNNVNGPPELGAIGARTVMEDSVLAFTLTSSDPDNDARTYSASPMPTGATLNATTGAFYWRPSMTQSGIYDVTFTATTVVNGHSDSETVRITVTNFNLPPTISINPAGQKVVARFQNLSFTLHPSDPDGCSAANMSLSSTNLPPGAILNKNSTPLPQWTFSWRPSFGQQGVYNVTFLATDDEGSQVSITVKITVT